MARAHRAMDILAVIDRSIRAEKAACAIYERLADRFAADPALSELWRELAADEHGHAANLSEWRARLAYEPWDRRPIPMGFGGPFIDLEARLATATARAEVATDPDEVFALALELESSELDAIYAVLMRCSSLEHAADAEPIGEHDRGRHHERLLEAVRARSRDEVVLRRAELLEAGDADLPSGDRF